MRHRFCKLLLGTVTKPKHLGVTHTRIGTKKYYAVQYLQDMIRQGVACCAYCAKYRALCSWHDKALNG